MKTHTESKPLAAWVTLAATGALFLAPVTLRATETDDRIETSARESYVFKTYLKNDSIKTESKDGMVVLTGSVADASHKSLAQDTVEGLPGVKSVDNRIRVSGDGPPEHSDRWMSLRVKATLLFHRNVSLTKTDVRVQEGVVTLTGEASSLAQKELTTEYAADIEGVKSVKNEMTISENEVRSTPRGEGAGDKIDDASITASVKAALYSHRSTSGLKTKVSTTDGVVTLGGVAKNSAEKSLVTKLVTDINGVTSVINNMTVAVPVAEN